MTSARMLLAAALVLVIPSHATAEWAVAAFLGASFTGANSLVLDQPTIGTHVTLAGVSYEERSFESPPYYGYRVARYFGPHVGVEAEFIHAKVYARSSEQVAVGGQVRGLGVNTTLPLGELVQRLSLSHGFNLILANVTWRSDPSGRLTFTARGGGGIAVPHGESTVGGVSQEQYEVSSAALQAAGGVELRIAHTLGVLLEYKLTSAKPRISVASGTITGRFVSQHVSFGLSWHTR